MAMCTTMIGVYLNAQLAYMLEDKNMFNIQSSEIGELTSQLTMHSIPFSMITTFFVSYLFEIFGRRLTLVLSYLLTAGIYLVIPYTSPDYSALTAMRCLLAITMSAPLSHPLIADMIQRSSRGKAIAFAGVGIVLGEVFSMGILFNLTKSLNYYDAFAIAAILIFTFSMYFMFAIKEPNFEHMREDKTSRHKQFRILGSSISRSTSPM